MINTLIKISFLFTCLMCLSQQGVVAIGGDASSESGSISFSVGQVLISQISPSNSIWDDENFEIGYGLQQVFLPSCLKNGRVMITATPNPSRGLVSINLSNWDEIGINLSIYNMLGKQFYFKEIKKRNTQLDLSFLETGVYLISINNVCGSVTTFKLIINKR